MYRKPVLKIINSSGNDIMPALRQYWKSASWTDNAGKTSDTAKIVMMGPPASYGLPSRDSQFSILAGWADTGAVLQGVYKVQNWIPHGDPEDGDLIDITLKAADFVDNLKQHGHKHYDEGTTFGQIVQSEAQDAGLSATVDPSLANIPMGYQLKWGRSPVDFIHEVAEMVGGTLKLAGGKLVVMKRGGGSSASGLALATIVIQRTAGYSYSCTFEPRPQHGSIAGAWIDGNGNRQLQQVQTGLQGPAYILPHPYRSQNEAQQAAQTESYERGNNTFSGEFDSPGLPNARAEAPVTLSGYGWPIDGPCKAESVTSTIDNAGGYMTTVNVKSGDSDKGKAQS